MTYSIASLLFNLAEQAGPPHYCARGWKKWHPGQPSVSGHSVTSRHRLFLQGGSTTSDVMHIRHKWDITAYG